MRKTLLPVLLAGVVMPFAALAQDNQTPATGTAPAATQDSAPAGSMEPAASPTGDAATTTSTTAPAGTAATTTAPAGTGTAATTDMEADTDTAVTTDTDTDDNVTVTTTTPSADTGTDMASTSAVEGPFVTVPPSGAWRASDLEGKDVYDTTGENIGSISDVLLSEDGEVMAVLVGVGGFLGIGQKDVAVAMDALEFGPTKTEGLPTEAEVQATAETAAPASGGMVADPAAPAGGDMTASTTETVTPVVGEDNLPDRIVLNVTRDELENAAAYGEAEDADDMDTTGAAPAEPAGSTGMAPASEAPAAQ
ncbi:MAG TPA: PRC-barrel domain-containing protein [Aurantimonas sp.]|nr:PRC-barrel domain-containing protein [Aurantimonas sp.]